MVLTLKTLATSAGADSLIDKTMADEDEHRIRTTKSKRINRMEASVSTEGNLKWQTHRHQLCKCLGS